VCRCIPRGGCGGETMRRAKKVGSGVRWGERAVPFHLAEGISVGDCERKGNAFYSADGMQQTTK